jgi:hypothetical protein
MTATGSTNHHSAETEITITTTDVISIANPNNKIFKSGAGERAAINR